MSSNIVERVEFGTFSSLMLQDAFGEDDFDFEIRNKDPQDSILSLFRGPHLNFKKWMKQFFYIKLRIYCPTPVGGCYVI